MVKAESNDVHIDLAQALQEFWDEYAGIRPTHVRVAAGEGVVAMWLEDALSPAGRQMASTREGRKMLQKLEERILEQARPQLQRLVEGAAGQESMLAEVHSDIANGSVLAFFQLGQANSPVSSSRPAMEREHSPQGRRLASRARDIVQLQ